MTKFFIFPLLLSISLLSSGQSILWKVSGNGLKKPSYLFGTIHIKDKRVFDFGKVVYRKLKSCETFAMELTPSAENLKAISQGMMLSNGQTLKDLYSADEYQLLADTLKKYTGMPIMLFNTMRPVALSTLLMDAKMKKDMDSELDMHLYNYAKEKGLETVGIETAEEQLVALEAMSPAYALDVFKTFGKYDSLFNKMINLYLDANLDELYRLLVEDETSGFDTDQLLDVRNIRMADRIGKMAQDKPVFAAFGAGHLAGKNGVIALLKKQGYTVTPIPTKNKSKK